MFKNHFISFVLMWFILVLGGVGFLYTFSSNADMDYQLLVTYGDQIKKERLQDHLRSTQQARHRVSKQILYKRGEDRLQTRLNSAESRLVYSKKDGEIVEHFKDLACMMQEELIGSINNEKVEVQQTIRQLNAREAVYSYKNGILEANDVDVAHYLLPGHLCPDSLADSHPMIQGKAAELKLSLFQEPSMQAEGFQAVFYDWGE